MLIWLGWLLIGTSLFMVAFYMNIYKSVPVEDEFEGELDEEPSVSVLMPAYNEEDVVEGAIKSSLDIEYENLDIIFVDDGSSDSTYSKAKNFKDNPNIKLIQHSENQGKGKALNTALENTDSKYTIVQDADSEIDGQLIRKSVAKLENDKNTGAVIASIRPLEADSFVQKLQIIEYTLTNFYRNLMSHVNILDMTPGAYSMYRTDHIKELGGFHEDHLTEDVELAWRIKRDGKSIQMAFHEATRTEFPGSLKALYNQRVRWARGFMDNAYDKRDMFFNDEYGWFGNFQLPAQVLVTAVSIIGFWLVAIGWAQILLDMLIQISSTGLELPSYGLENLKRTLLGFSAVIYIPMIASLGFSVYELRVAYSESGMKIRDALPLVFYFAVFFMMKGFFWMAAILKELTGSKKTWT